MAELEGCVRGDMEMKLILTGILMGFGHDIFLYTKYGRVGHPIVLYLHLSN